ncbi:MULTISPECIES: DUF3718 domain-containing protein [unclassified Thalassotalea]|uniref:DUF3718 domain-containing protein n=1 Tax=unclassified Thalassotalea TaxID=2614972 RepID=UPI00108030D8|nr:MULTISPECIES: DUF3718 domain-containing protein [unclassified Thalassotalea]NMP17075.1 DUF3718 domain-containing protein [Thalassotalea sp. Y01]QBY04711.1 DUF3718 domain-containing protein [Thalassotalea sp. HSM 43]
MLNVNARSFITKNLLTSIAALGIMVSGSAAAEQAEFVGTDNSPETKLCLAAAKNDKAALRHQIRQINNWRGIRPSYVIDNIACNDMDMPSFAYQYGADKTFDYLNRVSRKPIDTQVQIEDLAKLSGTIYVSASSK